MKKIGLLILLLCLFVQPIYASEDITPHAQSAYLIETSSKKVLYEKNAEEKLFPASMTKMMSLILVYEALHDERIKMDEIITVSEKAASMGGSQVFLQPNEQMKVSDLLKAVCIASANDAIVALAEKISGSVNEFVNQMNEKANELNLVNTHFVNTTGLHDDEHYSCAKDMAYIALKLIEIGDNDLLKITSTYDAYIREDTTSPFWLVNTNKLVKHIEGVDGLKTGFTQEALSCITLTQKKGDLRLVGVVMKEPDSKTRNSEVMDLMNSGFSKVKVQKMFSKNEVLQSFHFEFGLPHDTNLVYLQDVNVVLDVNQKMKVNKITFTQTKFDLPLHENEKMGEAKILFDDNSERIVDIGVNLTIEKMSFMDYLSMIFWRVLT